MISTKNHLTKEIKNYRYKVYSHMQGLKNKKTFNQRLIYKIPTKYKNNNKVFLLKPLSQVYFINKISFHKNTNKKLIRIL